MGKRVKIIGAGVAGLSAGSYLQMNGYESEILELHTVPGGLCTSWKRDGFVIDGCIHWLVGSGPGDPFHDMWGELLDLSSFEFVDADEYLRVEDGHGGHIRIATAVDELERELRTKAPVDAASIRSFCGAVRKLVGLRLPVGKAPELLGPLERLGTLVRLLPYLPLLVRWGGLSMAQFADSCQDPLLRRALRGLFDPEMPALFMILNLMWMHKRTAGYPVGGSLNFARRLAERYEQLGGVIRYRARVDKILSSPDGNRSRVTGVRLHDGEQIDADIVVSAADGYDTYFRMLERSLLPKRILGYYEGGRMRTFPSCLLVSFGVARSFANEPHSIRFPTRAPIEIDPATSLDEIHVRIYNQDPTLAPASKTVLQIMIRTRAHEHWVRLKEEAPEQYVKEKQRIAKTLIEELGYRFAGVGEVVEMTDVATPSTVVRYTNNWQGSYEGWLLPVGRLFSSLARRLPRLDGFFHAGHWVEPGGGLPAALFSGRNVVQVICKHDGVRFRVDPAVGGTHA